MASTSGPPARGLVIEIETGNGVGLLFTEAELAAADHLVQLSGSSRREGDDEASLSSSSSSPRSVNTGAAAWKTEGEEVALAGGPAGDELDWRARKRYRLLSDLYAATSPVTTGSCLGAAAVVTSTARKRKRHGEQDDGQAAMAASTRGPRTGIAQNQKGPSKSAGKMIVTYG